MRAISPSSSTRTKLLQRSPTFWPTSTRACTTEPSSRVLRLDNDRNPNSKVTYIQGGLNGKGKPLPPVAHETTTQTGIKHTDGVIAMIRQAPGTATSEFFIVIGDNPPFDAGGVRLPDGQGFSAFGRTVRGMDV